MPQTYRLFDGRPKHHYFANMALAMRTVPVPGSSEVRELATGDPSALPSTFEVPGRDEPVVTADFLAESDAAALLVMKNGVIRAEHYWLTGGRDVRWMSFSMAKSIVSALVGCAVRDGLFTVDDAISDHVPALDTSAAYRGVAVRDVLQMSSGASWNEDYGDPTSDINRYGRALAPGGSLDEFVPTLQRDAPPGTVCRYNTTDTQALGMLLAATTGRTVSDYMAEHLWEPLGADGGYWVTDDRGVEMTGGGFNATARDYAKFGQLYLDGGVVDGRPVIPAEWVDVSTRSTAAQTEVGEPILGATRIPLGYGYQWWVQAAPGRFSALGVYGQTIMVDRPTRTVVVVLSANRHYATGSAVERRLMVQNAAFLPALIAAVE